MFFEKFYCVDCGRKTRGSRNPTRASQQRFCAVWRRTAMGVR